MTGLGCRQAEAYRHAGQILFGQGGADLILKSTAGFSQAQIDALKDLSDDFSFMPVTAMDAQADGKTVRIQYMPLSELNLNRLELVEGKFPSTAAEMVVERESRYFAAYRVGDTVSYMGRDFTVSGVVVNPLMFSEEEEPSLTDADTYIDAVFTLTARFPLCP